MEREGIDTVLRQNPEGLVYGITYVDHKTQCVFNGSDLGKQYSARAVQERCNISVSAEQRLAQEIPEKLPLFSAQTTGQAGEQNTPASNLNNTNKTDLLEVLLQAEHTSGFIPYALTEKNRKKKKKSKSQGL